MARVDLTERDVSVLLRFVGDVRERTDPRALLRGMLTEVPRLVGCDLVSFFTLDSARRTTWALDPDDTDDDEDVFWAHYWGCLGCCYPDRSGDLRRVTRLSDFYSPRELPRVGMYVDYLAPAGLRHEIMVCLPAGPGQTHRLVLFRGPGRDFTERDRALLALVRPHLLQAHRDAATPDPAPPRLTARQRQLLGLVAAGSTNAQIARRLQVSEGTVRKHLENIFERLGVNSRTAAVTRAFAGRAAG